MSHPSLSPSSELSPTDLAANQRYESPRASGQATWSVPRVVAVVGVHLLAMLACVPWFFSWSGVLLCLVGIFVFGTVGINLGYHRLLSHRSFKCPKWLERSIALTGICALQGTPGRWVALHRLHHQHSDEEKDPHTPLVSLLWAHFEWVLTEDRRDWLSTYSKYAPDLMRDRFYLNMERGFAWLYIYLFHAAAVFAVGFAWGWLLPQNSPTSQGAIMSGVQLGSSLVVWGVFLRTAYVWHATWSVNSFTHALGYRNYETSDRSRNNWLVSLLASGEGWHNNHHADPKCAAAGHRWWEFDPTFMVIRGLALVGLAYDVVPRRVSREAKPSFAIIAADGSRRTINPSTVSKVSAEPSRDRGTDQSSHHGGWHEQARAA